MSSTNRSTAREKHVSDYYVTPQDMIATFLKAVNEDNDEFLEGWLTKDEPLRILDPCAGGDAAHPMAYPAAIERYSGWLINKISTIDLREDSLAERKEDFLFIPPEPIYDVVITNPPFNISMDVINRSFDWLHDGGLVVMLLRLNFFGSKERQPFWHDQMPVLTYVHTKRPRFLNTGGTDSIEYMHAVFRKGQNCKFTALRVI